MSESAEALHETEWALDDAPVATVLAASSFLVIFLVEHVLMAGPSSCFRFIYRQRSGKWW